MHLNKFPTHSYRNIVVLTGAGISAESGLKTFRGTDGIWKNYRAEQLATPEAFDRDPELVHDFYNIRRQQLASPTVQPNAAHVALAEFEQSFSGNFTLITQNVDDLHERAGSDKALHMHGELTKQRCIASGAVSTISGDISADTTCHCCHQQGNLRPHIVWFGEIPMHMDVIHTALSTCDLFVSIGTSGNVYPAAGFVELALQNGATTVELNLEPSLGSSRFQYQFSGLASKLVPIFFKMLAAP